jgi:hypothetical protein
MSLRCNAVEANTPSVDFPVPRAPKRTMDASRSKVLVRFSCGCKGVGGAEVANLFSDFSQRNRSLKLI